jgi:hypothetical protein
MDVNVQIPEPLWGVMQACEVKCVAGCCGLDAFDISSEPLSAWSPAGKDAFLSQALQQVDALMKAASSEDFYCSQHLNYCGAGAEWIEVLSKWKAAIEGARSSGAGAA